MVSGIYINPEMIYQFLRAPFSEKREIRWNRNLSGADLLDTPFYFFSYRLLEFLLENERSFVTEELLKNVLINEWGDEFNRHSFPWIDHFISDRNKEKLSQVWIRIFLISRLISVSEEGLKLTPAAREILENGRDSVLYFRLLKTFCLKFRWSYFDDIPDDVFGQTGFLFLLYLIRYMGSSVQPARFYADRYLQLLFPHFTEQFSHQPDVLQEARQAVYRRFFELFALWFGFIKPENVENPFPFHDDTIIYPASLLNTILFS